MGKGPRYTKDEVIEALRQANGLVSAAARALGCTPQTVYNYADRFPDVADVFKTQRREMYNTASNRLYADILRGEKYAILWVLNTFNEDGTPKQAAASQTNLNLNVDFSKLSDDELEELANGG